MGNWKLTRAQEPHRPFRPGSPRDAQRPAGRPVPPPAHPPFHRRGRGAVAARSDRAAPSGSCGPTCRAASAARSRSATSPPCRRSPAVQGVTLKDGAPAYFSEARAYVQLLDTTLGFQDGDSPRRLGLDHQRADALSALPAPRLQARTSAPCNYWFECPCHGSRYDRLGTKVQELGPAPRSLDRFASSVEGGVLTVDTSKITLGPLPVALGQPGLIPPARRPSCI